jgi:hypothetical protein
VLPRIRQVADAWSLGTHLQTIAPVAHLMLTRKCALEEGMRNVHGAFLVLYGPISCDEDTDHRHMQDNDLSSKFVDLELSGEACS